MVGIVGGAVFTLIGLCIVGGAIYGTSNLNRKSARQTAHPDQPWLWREDWANGTIRDTNTRTAIGLWAFAIMSAAATCGPATNALMSRMTPTRGNRNWDAETVVQSDRSRTSVLPGGGEHLRRASTTSSVAPQSA